MAFSPLKRRLQIILSAVVILCCVGFLLKEALFSSALPAGRSELSECHFLLKHSYVQGADGLQLVQAAARALEPHLPPDSLRSWKGVEEEEALRRLERMVEQAVGPEMTHEQAVYLGMDAMVDSLGDVFTSAMDPQEYSRFRESLSSQPFGGVGLQLGRGNGGTIVVFRVLEGSPAAKHGIAVGDLVLKVDGRAVAGLSPDEVEEWLSGEPGTAVDMTLSKNGTAYTLKLERVVLKTRSVRSRIVTSPDGTRVGWITVLAMKEETGAELEEELEALQAQHPEGLVLDLRDNMGGYVNAALAVCSQFLESGLPVVEIKSRDKSEVKATLAESHNKSPLLVLINGHTASSAEIVAACLQDYDRAVLVGERSFGKGSVQSIHEFDSGGALKFTVARYNSPEGRIIDGLGLEPDVVLDAREVLAHCEKLWKHTATY